MPRKRVSPVAIALALVAQLALPAVGAQPSAANPFEWRGVVLQGGTLEIKGVNGDVRAEPGSGAEAEVVARKTSRRSSPDDVRIEASSMPRGSRSARSTPTPTAAPTSAARAARGG